MLFETSCVTAPFWLPILVAFGIATVTSMGGLAGSVLLLPFQVSFLGFVSPGVTPTNLFFNIIATPPGIYSYHHSGRMIWQLAALLAIGTTPGVIIGTWIRLTWLADPGHFVTVLGVVLLILSLRGLYDTWQKRKSSKHRNAPTAGSRVTDISLGMTSLKFQFDGHQTVVSTMTIIGISSVVGLIGGTLGLGGAAIVVPILVSILHLPIHAIAGSALFGNFATAVIGVTTYALASLIFPNAPNAQPDWMLGTLFGIGGAAGTFLGAKLQSKVPAFWIAAMVNLVLLTLALKYLIIW